MSYSRLCCLGNFSNEYPFKKPLPLLGTLSFHLLLQPRQGLGPSVSSSVKAKCLHQSLSYVSHHCIISTIKNITFPNSIFQRRILILFLRVSLSAATAFLIIKVSGTGYESHQLHPAELAQDLAPCSRGKTLHPDQHPKRMRHLLELITEEN